MALKVCSLSVYNFNLVTFNKNWRYCNTPIIRSLYCQSYSRLLTLFPINKVPSNMPEIKDLYLNFRDYLLSGLQGGAPDRSNVHIGVSFLETLVSADPMCLDRDAELVSAVCSSYQKLCIILYFI